MKIPVRELRIKRGGAQPGQRLKSKNGLTHMCTYVCVWPFKSVCVLVGTEKDQN